MADTLKIRNAADTDWIEFSQIGPQGPQGDQGAVGAQGDVGAQGNQGNQGNQGSAGTQGYQGSAGVQGAQGDQGEQGNQGSEGAQGYQGVQGNQGDEGAQGDTGDAGPQGDQGDTGAEGPQGNQGDQGDTGAEGPQGDQGDEGAQGSAGAQGNQGDQGAQGDQGNQGDQGYALPVAGTDVELEEIGAATYDDVQDWLNSTQSAGRISGGGLTQNVGTPSTLDVGAGTGFIKVTNSDIAVTKFFDWDAAPAEALSDGKTNYIYVNYNIATEAVTVEVAEDRLTIPITNAFTLGRVYRDGDTLHIIVSGVNLYNYVRMAHRRLIEVRGFERASGGDIAESGQRYLTSTDGVFYLGSNRLATTGEDTTGADRFIGWYMDTGAWAETAPQQQIDNLQYNDVSVGGSETLANLTVNRYGVFWVYIHMDGDSQVLYGQGNYKLAGAEDAQLPASLPESLSDFGILAAKIIVQQGENNLLSIVSAYMTLFPVSSPDNHNDMGGLQGGTTDEYYHLTATEHGYVSGVNSQSLLTTATPAFAGLELGVTDDRGLSPILFVQGQSVHPIAVFDQEDALTDTKDPVLYLQHTTRSDMVDGFGVGIQFAIEDDTSGYSIIGRIFAIRDGADNEGTIQFLGGTGGTELFLEIAADGVVDIATGVTVGGLAGATHVLAGDGAQGTFRALVAGDLPAIGANWTKDAANVYTTTANDCVVPNAGAGTLGLVGDPWDMLFAEDITLADGGIIRCAGAPVMTFDDTLNQVRVTGAHMRVGYDTDLISYFGRAAVGYITGAADCALFGHLDRVNLTDYAFIQGTLGDTAVNCSAGQYVYIRHGGGNKVKVTATEVQYLSAVDIGVYDGAPGNLKASIDGATGDIYSAGEISSGILVALAPLHIYRNEDALGTPVAFFEQDHTTGGVAVIELQQDDTDKAYIDFTGTTYPGPYTGAGEFVQIEVNGNTRYLKTWTTV